MGRHVVVGAGPVGSAVARQLLAAGHEVVVVTRSGSGIDGVEKVAADAGDAARLTQIARGADAIYNCVNPPYHQWEQAWPPVAAALLAAAEANGAVLAITGNLYQYGKVDAPMTEQTAVRPNGHKGAVRARMWADALAAHEAGRVRAFEVRGSDYLGGNSYLSTLITPALRKGRTAFVPADVDAPHTWTNTEDVARTLIAGVHDASAHGRVWHVPSAPPASLRELTAMAAEQLDAQPKIRSMPYALLWLAGVFSPMLRELRETQYQFRAPFVLDSSAAQPKFGITPTPLVDSVRLDIASGISATATSKKAAR